jgi:hypothetical protein
MSAGTICKVKGGSDISIREHIKPKIIYQAFSIVRDDSFTWSAMFTGRRLHADTAHY